MIAWNEQRLKELVRKMGLRRTQGQGRTPIHLSLYGPSGSSESLLTKIMRLDAAVWSALGYDESDWVSVVRYLGILECRTDGAWLAAAMFQHPLSLELAKLLIDAGCDPTVQSYFGWDALVCLARGGHLVDPQVTDLFLSAGCRTDLDGCDGISGEHCLRFDQILKERAQWKEKQDCLLAENSPADTSYGPDWGR